MEQDNKTTQESSVDTATTTVPVVENANANEQKAVETVVESPKADKTKVKPKKDKKQKDKKLSKIGTKLKETKSELKKVTWPTFGQVVKRTGVVLAVVIIFTLVVFGIDSLLGWLYRLLLSAL
ncbi:MAG: preprotein translocase subunit SecE [Clostridia bacterium]|nr:preprotein translocase subunit SecE [Clostridia bacterium]